MTKRNQNFKNILQLKSQKVEPQMGESVLSRSVISSQVPMINHNERKRKLLDQVDQIAQKN
jgi:hypothetical protein